MLLDQMLGDCRVGRVTFYEATAHLRQGGRSLEELQSFPKQLAKDLAESETAMDVLSAGWFWTQTTLDWMFLPWH